VRLHPDDATRAGLAAGTLVELVGARVPLRAWVLVDATVPVGTVPADGLACRVLDLAPGAHLPIRAV
jgi:anaerobic selenocysteine-containing dehydrogenase